MKLRLGILAWLLSLPLTAHGHTEIFFPKLFTAAELSTSGFVLLNPDPVAATVNMCLFPAEGLTPPFFSCPKDRLSAPISIPAGGQFARLGSELFPNGAGGWVYAFSDTESPQGFWLNYDQDLTFLDGAEAVSYDAIGTDQLIPLIAGQVELNVINPRFNPTPLTLSLFGESGMIAPPVSRELPSTGGLREDVSQMFPAADMSQARYLRIRTSGVAGSEIASSAVIRGFLVPKESAVINGVNAGGAGVLLRTELTFPHVINGVLTGATYTTVIGITDVSGSGQDVRIVFHPDGKDPIEVTKSIPVNGAFRDTAQNLFNLSPDFQGGWVDIIGSSAIAGFAAYADAIGGGLAAVPAGVSQTKLFFAHIADGPPQWQTGLALLNATGTTANLEVFAVGPSGSLIGKTTLDIEPGAKIAKAIHELIPETRGINGGFVFVRSSNAVPIFGIELFYTEDLKVLSNVAAGKLTSGVVYVPPPM